jgi:16S rRNA (cytosine1402-N4)-methyltransferase
MSNIDIEIDNEVDLDAGGGSNVTIDYHVPVMMNECCDLLNIRPGGVYVDCTMGGGGHTRAILERGGRVIGIDQDPDSIARVKRLLSNYIAAGDLEVIQTNFRNIRDAIASSKLVGDDGAVDGVLMDLGISSFQIDEATRGFAFSQDGPLDMRMNKGMLGSELDDDMSTSKVVSAFDIINFWDANDIANILYDYGDEVRSRVIAREIVLARPLNTTGQLESVISRVTQFKQRSKTLARCFQALRIVVNDEIGALEDALLRMHECIRFEGRFVVMSYHSLEDRRIKQLFRDGVIQGRSVMIDSTDDASQGRKRSDGVLSIVSTAVTNPWKVVNKRAVVPTDEELQSNRRSRSAKLRCAEQIIIQHTVTTRISHTVASTTTSDVVVSSDPAAAAAVAMNMSLKNKKSGGAKVMGAKQLAKLRRRSMSEEEEEEE